MENQENLKTTCLHDLHVALGAKMSPFAGYDMPIEYPLGIVGEHNAVRNACGVFDVSHMGEVDITGDDAERFVQRIFSNDVSNAPDGQCFYGMMLNEKGGVVDDLLVYKRGHNHFLFVINAANIDKDEQWILSNVGDYKVNLAMLSKETSELAVQGPEAEKVMEEVLQIPCRELAFYTFKEIQDHDGRTIIVSRTGYTGEDGFEIYGSHDFIRQTWQKLMESGKAQPCGLGCRDTLRFEVGLPLYGDELSDDVTPLEASLGMFAKLEKENLIGGDALRKMKEAGVPRKTVGLEINDRAIARHGCDVLSPEGEVIGQVTTGYRGISTDRSICMALIDANYSKMGTELKVQVRRKVFPATVVSKKFYKKSYKK